MANTGVIVAVVVIGGVTVGYFAIPEMKAKMDEVIFDPIRNWLEESGINIGGNTGQSIDEYNATVDKKANSKVLQDLVKKGEAKKEEERLEQASIKATQGGNVGYPVGQCFQIQQNGQLVFCFRNKRCGGSMVSVCGRSKSVPCTQVRADWIKHYGCKARAGYYKIVR